MSVTQSSVCNFQCQQLSRRKLLSVSVTQSSVSNSASQYSVSQFNIRSFIQFKRPTLNARSALAIGDCQEQAATHCFGPDYRKCNIKTNFCYHCFRQITLRYSSPRHNSTSKYILMLHDWFRKTYGNRTQPFMCALISGITFSRPLFVWGWSRIEDWHEPTVSCIYIVYIQTGCLKNKVNSYNSKS